MKEIQVTLPTDRKTLMDEFLKEFSVLATTYDFGETIRYELRIKDYQTNMLIEELKAGGGGASGEGNRRSGIGWSFPRVVDRGHVIGRNQAAGHGENLQSVEFEPA